MNILITGGNGMVGMNLKDNVLFNTSNVCYYPSSKDMNLLDLTSINNYIVGKNINFVIHLAANVGGLYKNMNNKVEMFHDNVIMNENILKCCYDNNIKNGLFCCSTCIFPNNPPSYPMDESMMMLGEPHTSNDSYAYAKRFLFFQCQNYNKQYGCKYLCITPCNLYGLYDNFNIEDAHVIPALIHKFYIASLNNTPLTITTGLNTKRQFIHAQDLCNIIQQFITDFNTLSFDNVIVCDNELLLVDIIDNIASHFENVNYTIVNDEKGQAIKTCSNNKLLSIIHNYTFSDMNTELGNTITWFKNNYDNVRK